MMDRNLGATSATPGEVGAFGLLYQWGRKDPFMGTCAKSGTTLAASTGTWTTTTNYQDDVYLEENPMSFFAYNNWNCAWHVRWEESIKNIYDPCPVGYRVPKGGNDGFWATALGTSSNAWNNAIMKWTNNGFTWTLADGTTAAWYPAVGYRYYDSGALNSVGSNGYYWSASPYPSDSYHAYYLRFHSGNVYPADYYSRSYGCSVRCVRESY